MNIDEKRQERQLAGLTKWNKAGGIGTLNYETGVGKTHTAFLLIQKIFESRGLQKIAIAVPSAPLIDKWKKDIDNYIISPEQKESIVVYGANEIVVGNVHDEVYLLIIDEIHEFFSDNRENIIKGTYIQHKYRLGLTGTPPEDRQDFRMLQGLCPIVDTIDSKEALREGFIAPYIVYNLGVELTDYERGLYDGITNRIEEYFVYFDKRFDTVQACISGNPGMNNAQIHKERVAKFNGWDTSIVGNPLQDEKNRKFNPYKIGEYAFELMKLFRERATLLYNAENKLTTALKLVEKFKSVKIICFSESVQFADRLGLLINREFQTKNLFEENAEGQEHCVVFHSQLETKLVNNPKTGKPMKFGLKRQKDEAEAKIRSGQAKVISTVAALDKGFDVHDLRLAIITSRTSKVTQWKQRTGRVKRLDLFDETAVKIIVNVYSIDTQDEAWVKNGQRTDFMTIREVYDINSIEF
jgi:superfamily II DNA or RNA helicase